MLPSKNILRAIKEKLFLISWIFLISILFYNTFMYYLEGSQFSYLRCIIGFGLCVSRATASVINVCCALILLPLCKKLNSIFYKTVSLYWPRLFFIWLKKAKSLHMTVAVTLIIFSVAHSVSHLVNLWNFSSYYDEKYSEVNVAIYKNQNPMILLLSRPGLTGMLMLLIILIMGLTSSRNVRKKYFNTFWFSHQLFIPFMILLLVHPLSGVLKEEVLVNDESDNQNNRTYFFVWKREKDTPKKFISIRSETCRWMVLPLTCFVIDFIWRMVSRYSHPVEINKVQHMPGRILSLTLSCPEKFICLPGQYILLHCPQISLLEWHPFSIVQIPTEDNKEIKLWIKISGDWTKELELLLFKQSKTVCILIDGPFSSPLQEVIHSRIAICVAAGIGITPFVSLFQGMNSFLLLITKVFNFYIFLWLPGNNRFPKNNQPQRIHLIWIVRNENELIWIAKLATDTMKKLNNVNRIDRLHLEFYVTNFEADGVSKNILYTDDERSCIKHKVLRVKQNVVNDRNEETRCLREHIIKQNFTEDDLNNTNNTKEQPESYVGRVKVIYPLIGCRIKKGRPDWDKQFVYWSHVYPRDDLRLFACGPKTLIKDLNKRCKKYKNSGLNISFIHEGF